MSNTPIKSISKLIDDKCHFIVEDYQRGYKWTETEVTQLLNDINEFDSKGYADSFYCLQPIVVKKVKENDKIELIDGQQRVTTIFIILSYLNISNKYKIDYKTRESSATFINDININGAENWDNKFKTTDKNNIDNYHFHKAYACINNWFSKKNIDKDTFSNKLRNNVKVIWYEVLPSTDKESKQESIKIFTRINSGKIQLTNAELIKALFLINVEQGKNAELVQLKQNEIAQQWDTIEYVVQNDSFWYFISNDTPPSTRIDFIFDLIVDEKTEENIEIKKTDKLYTFLVYNNRFANKQNEKAIWVHNEWEKVKNVFQTLKEWYEDRELYHLIGFLISIKFTIKDIYYNIKSNKETKTEFKQDLKNKIKTKVKDYNIYELSYAEDKHKEKINNILLLYNIQTEINNENTNSRYQFDRHKEEKWSLEHIHAQKQPSLNSQEKIEKYTTGFIDYIIIANLTQNEGFDSLKDINKELSDKIKQKVIFDEVKQLLDKFIKVAKETYSDLFDLDDLSNLALLSSRLNAAISNGFFDEKRKNIIDFEKKGEFIPICTRNVFLKYYSDDQKTNLFYWSNKDREDYLEDIKCTLKDYIDYTRKK